MYGERGQNKKKLVKLDHMYEHCYWCILMLFVIVLH